MDIAPVLLPGTAVPSADAAAGTAAAVPTAPGQAFSDLFAEALTGSPISITDPVITPGMAVVALPGAETTPPKIDPTAAVVPTDVAPTVTDSAVPEPTVPIATIPGPTVKVAVKSASPPTEVNDPPPPEALISSRKEAQAEVPNAPATEQDQPENQSEKTSTEAKPLDLTVVENAAALTVATPAPVVANANPVKAPAPQTKSKTEKVSAASTTSVQDVALDASATDAPAIAEPVVNVSVAVTDKAPATDKPAPADAPKLEAAPDLGIVPIVTVTPATTETAKAPIKEAAVAISTANTITAEPIKAPEVKNTEVKPAADKATAAFTDVLMEEAVKGGKESTADTGDGTNDQPASDPASLAPTNTVRSAATEKPTEGNNRPEVDRHLVVKQVADRIENLVASRPRDGVTIHLEPRDLGTITLVVKGLASALDVQVTASDSRVREGLEASRPDLALALAPRGIELRDVRIATSSASGSQTGSGSRDGGSNPNPDGRPRQQSSNSSTQSGFTESSRRPSASAVARSLRRSGGVDLLA